MLRVKLRTLLIVLAVLPPVLGGVLWAVGTEWTRRVRRMRESEEARAMGDAFWEAEARRGSGQSPHYRPQP